MCYRREICPLYRPDGMCEECLNCIYLQRAKRSILNARIALAIAVAAFIVITCMVW